jgi:YD repeat-containing protein
MHIRSGITGLAAALALAACGSDDPATGSSASAGGANSNSNVTASAKQVAKEARGKVRCPAKIATPPRAAQAPVDDVVGVRPGLTYDEAANVVLCTDPLLVVKADGSRGFDIKTYGQTLRQGFAALPAGERVEKTSQQIMQELQDEAIGRSGNRMAQDNLQPGQSEWFVTTMGLPGAERVIGAAREERYADGRNPTMDSVRAALLTKYGQPTRSQDAGGRFYITWAYDPFGRPITETSPLYNRCTGNASPDGGMSLSPDCGLVVMAIASPMRDNPALAYNLQVGVIDQANGYELLTATQQGLQQQDTMRQAQQVEAAAKNADAPTL